MLSRRRVYLELRQGDAPPAAHDLERDGFVVLPQLLDSDEVAALRVEVARVYAELPGDLRDPRRPADEVDDFRYEMLNRSAAVQRLVGDRRILDIIEPLLGEDCHVIANTAWRNPPRPEAAHGDGNWHIDAGPHIPRPADVPWDDRIPYPVFAIAVHVMLEDCPLASGPTEVIAGSHRSGQPAPFERVRDDGLAWNGVGGTPLPAAAGDVVLFVSDVWHRRHPTAEGDTGRFFVQIHYGRRDLAQRLRPTAVVNHLSAAAVERAMAGEQRDQTVVGLHPPFFYDA